MGKSTAKSKNIAINEDRSTWQIEGDLGISAAAEIAATARKFADDDSVRNLTVKLPNDSGVPLATYQILRSLERTLEAQGRTLDIEGHLAPVGGRVW